MVYFFRNSSKVFIFQLEFAYFCNDFTTKSISDLKGEGQGQDYFCITLAIMTLVGLLMNIGTAFFKRVGFEFIIIPFLFELDFPHLTMHGRIEYHMCN